MVYAICAGWTWAEEESDEKTDQGLIAYRDNCLACHQASGWGNANLDCPSIAGLPRWYVSRQLREFRTGHRGLHRDDQAGRFMRTVAARLNERDIAFLGRYIESLKPNPKRRTTGEFDASLGRTIYEKRCQDCHGPVAQGDRTQRVPPLDKQPDWYLLTQMWKFERGARIHDPDKKIPIDIKKEAGIIAAYLASLGTEGQ